MTLHRIRNFQRPVNLSSNVGLAPLTAWQWLLCAAAVVGVIACGTDKQIAFLCGSGNIPHHLSPLHLVVLVVGVIVTVCVSATVVVGDLRTFANKVAVGGRVQQNGAGDVGLHGESPNGGDVQHNITLQRYSAHAIPIGQLFLQFNAGWPFFLGKRRQAGFQNNPISTHFTGRDSPLTAELKNPLLANAKRAGGFLWGANQIKCGLCHAEQHSGVAA